MGFIERGDRRIITIGWGNQKISDQQVGQVLEGIPRNPETF
jgi:hypothetical protein